MLFLYPIARTARALALVSAGLAVISTANATDLLFTSATLSATDPTQLGRIARTLPPSDWSTQKSYPGTFNAGTLFHYTMLSLDITALESAYAFGPYIEVTFDSLSSRTFLSAYLDSYDPTNLASNYLGDVGGSTFGSGDVSYMDLVVPQQHQLILVMNETSPNGGLNMPANIVVQAFANTLYDDLSAAPVPEPASGALISGGLLLLLGATFRRRNAGVSV